MVLSSLRLVSVAAAVLAAGYIGLDARTAEAQHGNGAAPLFANYYAPGAVNAAMYPSPRPTPPFVGHTYYTYQPFYPHEFLYEHERVYHTRHPYGASTSTHAKWYSSNWGPAAKRFFVGPN